MALIEVFTNDPPGNKCNQLVENVERFVEDNQEHACKFYKVGSKIAKEIGNNNAPSVLVNRKLLLNGVASYEGIQKLIEDSKPEDIGLILTRSPGNSEYQVVEEILASPLGSSDSYKLFLLNDGVWVARKDSPIHERISRDKQSVSFFCIDKHLTEAGINKEELDEDVETIDLNGFVDHVMTCDKTVSL